MNKYSKKKSDQLGMNFSTACARLKKQILFNFIKMNNMDICFRCGLKIKTYKELSIDHKIDWLDNDVKLFWDLENISFSHIKCNSRYSTYDNSHLKKHPCISSYRSGCRCDDCKQVRHKKYIKKEKPYL